MVIDEPSVRFLEDKSVVEASETDCIA